MKNSSGPEYLSNQIRRWCTAVSYTCLTKGILTKNKIRILFISLSMITKATN